MSPARVMIAALLPVALASCSPEPTAAEMEGRLKAATLAATRNADNASVLVSDQIETASKWIWNATVNGKAFRCDVDTFFELPACEPVPASGE